METEIRVLKYVNNKETKLFVKRLKYDDALPYHEVLRVLRLLYPDADLIQFISFINN